MRPSNRRIRGFGQDLQGHLRRAFRYKNNMAPEPSRTSNVEIEMTRTEYIEAWVFGVILAIGLPLLIAAANLAGN
jgi:hypothetical protein